MRKSLKTKLPVTEAYYMGSNNRLKLTFISPAGRRMSVLVPCSLEQYERWLQGGETVERIFPLLDDDMQELFRTGMGRDEARKYRKRIAS